MELTTSQDILVRGLQKIQGIVERKNTLPILSHFLLTARDDETIIHATDLELGYKGYLDTTVNKPGTATLPARKTYDILREYPALPPVEEAEFSSLDSEVLEEMIRQTIFATSHDETRYTLSGVLVVCDSKEMTMVATDGHRLAHTRRPVSFGRELRVIVPRKALEEVSRFAADSEEKMVEVAPLQNHLVFRKGRATLVTRLIEGQFPDYEGVVPKTFQRRATVEHERLTRALRRVSLLSNEKTKPVRVEFTPDNLILRSNTPEMGEATEQIPAEYQGETMVMGFNARYLLDALAVTTDEHVALDLNDPLSPGIIRPLGDEQYFYVIMPMRV